MFSISEPIVAANFEALLAGASERVPVRSSDAKSGSQFEKVVIDGERYFFKSLSYDEDWIMRVTGDVDHRQFKVWKAGLYRRFPASIDHSIVAMAIEGDEPHPRLGILMHDVAASLIPEGDDVVSEEIHLGLIADMARLHAAFIGFKDEIGLTPQSHRFRFFALDVIAPELARSDVSPVIQVADQGWQLLPERSPRLAAIARQVHAAPEPLAAAMAATPATLVSGDWKMGNLGWHPDGRSVVLDQAYPGEGPGCWDLGWYLALNRARLPISKDETVEWYRETMESCGVDTSAWFAQQIELCLLGIAVCFGWEKALGDADELAWWTARADAAVAHLDG